MLGCTPCPAGQYSSSYEQSACNSYPTPSPTQCSHHLILSPKARDLYSTHELFGRLTQDRCAWTLEYGNVALDGECSSVFNKHPGFISTSLASTNHNRWWQVITSDGSTPIMHILYHFNVSRSLAKRFQILAGGTAELGNFEVSAFITESRLPF